MGAPAEEMEALSQVRHERKLKIFCEPWDEMGIKRDMAVHSAKEADVK